MGFKERVNALSPVLFSHLCVVILSVKSDGQTGEQTSMPSESATTVPQWPRSFALSFFALKESFLLKS